IGARRAPATPHPSPHCPAARSGDNAQRSTPPRRSLQLRTALDYLPCLLRLLLRPSQTDLLYGAAASTSRAPAVAAAAARSCALESLSSGPALSPLALSAPTCCVLRTWVWWRKQSLRCVL